MGRVMVKGQGKVRVKASICHAPRPRTFAPWSGVRVKVKVRIKVRVRVIVRGQGQGQDQV